MKPLMACSLFFLCFHFGTCQDSRRISVEQAYILQNGKYLDSLELDVAIPSSYEGRQTVNEVSYSTRPKYMYKEDNVTFAHFALKNRDLKRTDTIKLRIDMTLFNFDFVKAKAQRLQEKLKNKDRKRYLLNTGLYELPKEQNFDLSGDLGDVDTFVMAKGIHDFVVNHVSYQTFFGKDQGATYALKQGKGDCTEYADLMIAICRKNKLPARRVSGCTVQRPSTNLLSKIFKYSSHAWVEVYFDGLGWVPFDPTHSDGSPYTDFNNLETKYVYYAYDQHTKRLDSWKYWGSAAAPFKVDRKTYVTDFGPEKNLGN